MIQDIWYDINIKKFDTDILSKNYLHDLMILSSKIYNETLFIFARSISENIYVALMDALEGYH